MDQQNVTNTAEVSTDRPARYGKQLAAHLGRRSGSHWDDQAEAGWIDFNGSRADLTAKDGTLTIVLTTQPSEQDKLEDVVGRHLVRFGSRDELVVAWNRSDGSAGSRQIKAQD